MNVCVCVYHTFVVVPIIKVEIRLICRCEYIISAQ